MTEEEAKRFLEAIEPVTEITSDQRRDIEDLLQHRGMFPLLGLLLAERNGFLQMLANSRVGDMNEARLLGVLQGQVKGVDRLRHIILECVTVPADHKED